MKKTVLILCLSLVFISVHAQKASQKSISEVCECVKKIDKKLTEKDQTDQAIVCMSVSIGKNIEALKKEYNITSENASQAAEEVGTKLGMQLVSGCPEILPYLMSYSQRGATEVADINPDTLKLDSKACALFKSGKFKSEKNYVNKKEYITPDPTAYTEVKDGFVYDYSNSNKYLSKWSIRQINACEWEQILVETSEPDLKTVMKKGDKITMKTVGSTPSGSLWVSTQFMGMDLLMLYTKMK